jgi:hypothetical protein
MAVLLTTGVIGSALSPPSTRGLALAGIIAGVVLGVLVFWFVRTCKLKANVPIDESSPLLHPDQIRTDFQVRNLVVFTLTQRLRD